MSEIGQWSNGAVTLFVKRVRGQVQPLESRTGAGVTNDLEEPGSSIAARKRPEVPKRAQRGVLNAVIRIVRIGHQRARQSPGGPEVGQYDVFEVFRCHVGSVAPPYPHNHRQQSHSTRTALVQDGPSICGR